MNVDDGDYVCGSVTDPNITRSLTIHLLHAFNDFVECFDGELTHAEVMMAAHNFHVFVIEKLVEVTDDDIWRNGALATFGRRMKNPGEYDARDW